MNKEHGAAWAVQHGLWRNAGTQAGLEHNMTLWYWSSWMQQQSDADQQDRQNHIMQAQVNHCWTMRCWRMRSWNSGGTSRDNH
jgi:hypothetical protein